MDADALSPAIGDWKIAEDISRWIEIVAIAVIAVAVVAAFAVGVRAVRPLGVRQAVEQTKHVVGRGLLLVIVRTFLAWSLMVELHGRWPWQQRSDP